MRTFCFIVPYFIPHIGGIERYTLGLANELIRRGEKVIVLCHNDKDIYQKDNIGEIVVYRIGSYILLNGRWPLPKPNLLFFSFLGSMFRQEIDTIVINGRFYVLGLIVAFLYWVKRSKVILIEHGTSHFTLSNKILTNVAKFYDHLSTIFYSIFIKDFYGVSQKCCEWLRHFKINCRGVIYNSIYEYKLDCLTITREKLSCSDSDVIISFAGRLIEEKGVIELITAFDRICKRYNHVKLIIAGTGPLEPYINSITNSNVLFLGSLDHSSVLSLLKVSDIFVHPSRYPEGLPTVLLEAAIMKCAIITTPAGGSSEVINSEEYGIIINCNPTDIENALVKLIENPELRVSISNSVYMKVKDHFTWEKTVEQFYTQLGGLNE